MNNDIFEIGDFIMLQSLDSTYYVGKLHKIITDNGMKKAPYWPCIEIQLYIFKDKIDREFNGINDQEKYDSISHYEVFKTETYIKDYAENILCHCKLLSLQDYESSNQHSENSFFTRAIYDFNTVLLIYLCFELENTIASYFRMGTKLYMRKSYEPGSIIYQLRNVQ